METSARIPKNFSPEKYTIKFSLDYAKLKYTIQTEILINSLSDKYPFLIINANKFKYKIIYLLLYKFENIADEWVEIGKPNKDSLIPSHTFFYELFGENKKYEVEEGLYIPIEKEVKKGEKLKLLFEVEGKFGSDMVNALYLTTNLDEEREFFDNKNKFEESWLSKYNNLIKTENLSENKFFQNLCTVFLCIPTKFRSNMP